MSEIKIQEIRDNFPKFDLRKLSAGQAKKIANKFFKTKKYRGMFGTKDLIKVRINNRNIFSEIQEDEISFYRLELDLEQ